MGRTDPMLGWRRWKLASTSRMNFSSSTSSGLLAHVVCSFGCLAAANAPSHSAGDSGCVGGGWYTWREQDPGGGVVTFEERGIIGLHKYFAYSGTHERFPWRKFAIGQLEVNGVVVNLPWVAWRKCFLHGTRRRLGKLRRQCSCLFSIWRWRCRHELRVVS